jgi:hypothetical protein
MLPFLHVAQSTAAFPVMFAVMQGPLALSNMTAHEYRVRNSDGPPRACCILKLAHDASCPGCSLGQRLSFFPHYRILRPDKLMSTSPHPYQHSFTNTNTRPLSLVEVIREKMKHEALDLRARSRWQIGELTAATASSIHVAQQRFKSPSLNTVAIPLPPVISTEPLDNAETPDSNTAAQHSTTSTAWRGNHH